MAHENRINDHFKNSLRADSHAENFSRARVSRRLFKNSCLLFSSNVKMSEHLLNERVLRMCLNFFYSFKRINDIVYPQGNTINQSSYKRRKNLNEMLETFCSKLT